MKRLFEFKTYDILQDKDNEKFLDKVKKENPELYTRFLNLVGNKGLDVAKEKYKEFDPEYVKIQKQKEKEEKALRKKIGNKERNKQLSKELEIKFLKDYKSEIEYVENILLNSPLKTLEQHIQNNKIIGNLFKEFTKRYKNDFHEKLKKPRLSRGENLDFHYKVLVDSLSYSYVDYEATIYSTVKIYKKVMTILQYYDASTKNLSYNIYFDFPHQFDYNNFIADRDKEDVFIQSRNTYITDVLSKSNIDKAELYDIIFGKLEHILKDEVYDNWKMKHDANKYNL